MKCEPSEDDPFSFEGPEIFKCKGKKLVNYFKYFFNILKMMINYADGRTDF